VSDFVTRFRTRIAKYDVTNGVVNEILCELFYEGLSQYFASKLDQILSSVNKTPEQLNLDELIAHVLRLYDVNALGASSNTKAVEEPNPHVDSSGESSDDEVKERRKSSKRKRVFSNDVSSKKSGKKSWRCRDCEKDDHIYYECPKRDAADNARLKAAAEAKKKFFQNSGNARNSIVINKGQINKDSKFNAYIDEQSLISKSTVEAKTSDKSSKNVYSKDFEEKEKKDSPVGAKDHYEYEESWLLNRMVAVFSEDRTTVKSVPKPYMLKVEVDNIAANAMIDPGTGVSILAKTFAERLTCPIGKSTTVFHFPDKRIQSLPSFGVCTTTVKCGDIQIKHDFEVLDLNVEADCLIGRDIFHALGSNIILPVKPHSIADLRIELDGELEVDDSDPSIAPVKEEDTKAIELLMQELRPDIEKNLALGDDTFCNCPFAEVSFELKNSTPICLPQYNIPHYLKEQVAEKIADWQRRGRIIERKASSPYNLPLTVAPKRDELGKVVGVRVCLDLRKLNEVMIGEGFQAIDVNQVLLRYNGAEWFSEVDLSEAYLQLKVKEEHREYLSFTFNNKQYSFVGAPFGAKHLTAFFQKVINQVFHDYEFVNPYVDNIGVMSKTFEEHIKHCKLVLQRLTQVGLKINVKKCKFGGRWMRTLGRIVSRDGIRADPLKVQGIMNLSFPRTAKEVQSFLGLVNFLRSHVKNAADLTARFDDVREPERFKRAMAKEASRKTLENDFGAIKAAMANLVVLTFPDYGLPFHISCDASDVAMGAVLFQKKADKVMIVATASQKFKKYECNYTVHKKEMRAIVFALSKFRYHIWCSPFTITLYTDHQALQDLQHASQLPRTFNGWMNIISDFNLQVAHIPGKQNAVADALSRLTVAAIETRSKDNKTSPAVQTSVAQKEAEVKTDEKNDQTKEAENVAKSTSEEDQNELTASEKAEIVKFYHSFGHFGREATLARIRMAGFNWARIHQDVKETLRLCDVCNKYNYSQPLYHELKTVQVDRPWQIVQADLVSSVKPTKEHTAILVVKCCFSAYVAIRALKDKSAASVAKGLFEVFSLYGPPVEIQADGGKEFTNELIKDVWDKLGVKKRFSTPYNPRAQGVVERAIGPITNTIWKELDGKVDWSPTLARVEFYFNTVKSSVTKETPFYLMFGRDFWTNIRPDSANLEGGEKEENEKSWRENWDWVRNTLYPQVAELVLNARKAGNKRFNNTHRLRVDNLQKGTLVMIKDQSKTRKEEQKFIGPFKIEKKMWDNNYAVSGSDGLWGSTVPLNDMRIIDEKESEDLEPRYEIEKILNHREGHNGETEYFIKWKGYRDDQSTWEPKSHIDDDECIRRYWRMEALHDAVPSSKDKPKGKNK